MTGPGIALRGGTPVRSKPFARWPVHDEAERRLLLEVLDGGEWAYLGPKEEALAKRFARYCDSDHAILVTSGTIALEVALRSLGIGPGDEVIVPGLTWTAPAWAVIQAGADVVFADVGADWCLDAASVEACIGPRTRMILAVHTYCNLSDMDALRQVARGHDLLLFEDAAHTPGGCWRDRPVGSLGDVAAFSFQLGKSMTAGEGGAIVTSDPLIAERASSMRNCGRPAPGSTRNHFSGNYRITEFHAALLLAQLDRLDSQIDHRTKMVRYFEAALAEVPGIDVVPNRPEMTRQGMFGLSLDYQPEMFAGAHVDVLIQALLAEGVPAKRPHVVVYRSPFWQAALGERFWHPGDEGARRLGLHCSCPVAEDISDRRGVVLPHQVFLSSEEDVDDIVEAFSKLRKHADQLRA